MLKAHYEKIILLISVLIALTFGLLMPLLSSLFSDGDSETLPEGSAGEAFFFSVSDGGLQTLEISKDTGLMPGDTITFVSIEDEKEAKAFRIPKVILENRSRLTVGFGKKEIRGTLFSPRTDIVLDGDWKKFRTPLEIANEEGRGRATIAFSQINYISGERLIAFDDPIEELQAFCDDDHLCSNP